MTAPAVASAAPPFGARPTTEKRPTEADVQLSLPLPPSGDFSYTTYAGPMEYDRLGRLGRGFDDVNPYGWPGFRTIIRPVAVGVRWLLVWMHEHLHLAYGLVLVFFGILVRVLLWPLNQKAMRANMQLQAVQPLMKEIQERHKNDPQKLQQEMFKLYKEYNVNPLGGCWPMLLPMPVLFALFFVFQNTIELRGASFLWLPDLSRPDPLYIIPVIMGASMWGLSKVGQVGMEPNPQMKMMLYVMPIMMTFLFLNFASGLNLYYAVSNIASIPQQWMLARERLRKAGTATVEHQAGGGGGGEGRGQAEGLRRFVPRCSPTRSPPSRRRRDARPSPWCVSAAPGPLRSRRGLSTASGPTRLAKPRSPPFTAPMASPSTAASTPCSRLPTAIPARISSSSRVTAGCSRPPGCWPRSTPPVRAPRRRASSPAAR